MRRTTLLLLVIIVILGVGMSITIYQYIMLETRYNSLLKEVEGVTVRVNILIDYGDGRRVWHNNTITPVGWSLLNVTSKIAKVTATYYPQYDSYFIDAIDDVGLNKPKEKESWFWMIWIWDPSSREWKISEVAADDLVMKNDDIVAWVFQDTSSWPPKPPS